MALAVTISSKRARAAAMSVTSSQYAVRSRAAACLVEATGGQPGLAAALALASTREAALR